MRPLKVLHIATHNGVYRGGAIQLCRMARGLKARGHAVRVLAAVHTSDSPERQKKDAATWQGVRDAGIEVDFLNYKGVAGLFRLRRYLAAHNFGIIHAHRDDALAAAWMATLWGGGPTLIAQRGTTGRSPRFMRHVFASGRTRAVVAVAEAVRQALLNDTGADPAKIHVVYGSVDLEQFRPRERTPDLRRELELPADAVIMGSLSAFRGKKGFDYMIPALAKAMRKNPDLYGIFLGKGVEERVRPFAVHERIAERCRFLGHQDDVARWLSIMDFTVVSATRREGLSGVLRESLAAGVPVISTDCSGNGEIVQDGVTGLLLPPRRIGAMAEAITWASEHPEEMKAMAERGRAWVRENCSLEVQAERVEEVYRKALTAG